LGQISIDLYIRPDIIATVMNIFCLSEDPTEAAQMQCDKHVAKMCVEYSQLLATCFSLSRLAEDDCPRTQSGNPRKHFNPKHPSSIWTRLSKSNMRWLIRHATALFDEFELRFNKKHFCRDFLSWVILNIYDADVEEGKLTDFSIAISQDSLCRQDFRFDFASSVDKYRLYYIHDKKAFAKWNKGRSAPQWYYNMNVKA